MNKIRAAVTSVSGYLPDYILTNKELESMVDTNDEWILSRTGIKERHILKGDGLANSDMAVPCVQELLKKRGIKATDIQLIIYATVTGDHVFPASANILADKIGAVNAWGFDLNAACSGFLFALTTGAQFIQTGSYDKVLIIGSDVMSSIIDYKDRATCVIFGDGAGAVLLEPTTDDVGVMDHILYSDGSGRKHLHITAGGSYKPSSHETVDKREHFVYQEGQPVFRAAVKGMAEVSAEIMKKNNLSSDDIAWLVPHQANKRIIDGTARMMGIGDDKVMLNIDRYGNTTAATLPLCLNDWESQLKKGDNLILSAFGGGYTWGAIWLKWAY